MSREFGSHISARADRGLVLNARVWRLTAVLLMALGMPIGAHADASLKDRAEGLGLSCRKLSGGGTSLFRCDGMIESFDGVPLDVSVSLPPGASSALPTVLQLGGWPGGKWLITDTGCGVRVECDPFWPEAHHWNEVWFTYRGYVHMTYTARGFGQSCGLLRIDAACISGYTHLADDAFEIRDSKHLLGVLVDAGIADGARLAATGESYGGGQAWRLAVSMPWSSPAGATLQLAAAIPTKPWTDLHGALVPNGRASDDVDQSASHSEPFGVPKSAYLSSFYAVGLTTGSGRYNLIDPKDLGSNFTAALAFWTAGDPYNRTVRQALTRAWRAKSAYYADDYLAALETRTVEPVPTFAVSGWTDPLFPVVESMQMYRKLRAADPSYPITLAFADAGHDPYHSPLAEWRALSELTNAFLDAHVVGSGVPPSGIISFETSCPEPKTLAAPVMVDSIDDLASASSTIEIGDASLVWVPIRDDPRAAPPLAGLIGGPRCPTPSEPVRSLTAALTSRPVTTPTTLLGLPVFEAEYELVGRDAILVAKVWDRAPGGQETLVTRGVYRIALDGGDGSAGAIRFQLNGNHWTFEPGHEIVVELSSTDAPFLRPNNQPFILALSNARLTVPTM